MRGERQEPLKKYEALTQQLRNELLQAPAQEKIESETALCERFQVSRITVRRAIAELAREGLLETVQGKGTFVSRQNLYTAPRFRTIGLITYDYDKEIFGDMIRYTKQVLSKNGYSLITHLTG